MKRPKGSIYSKGDRAPRSARIATLSNLNAGLGLSLDTLSNVFAKRGAPLSHRLYGGQAATIQTAPRISDIALFRTLEAYGI